MLNLFIGGAIVIYLFVMFHVFHNVTSKNK